MTTRPGKRLPPHSEGQLTAFLPELTGDAADQFAATLVALANADGGTIYIPAAEPTTLAARIVTLAQAGTLPPVAFDLHSGEWAGRPALLVQIAPSAHLHTTADGRAYVRVGSENRLVTGDHLLRLAASKSHDSFEDTPVAKATLEAIDSDLVADYCRRGNEPVQPPAELLPAAALSVDDNGRLRPTVAGLLLFGRQPERYLPQSGAVFVRYAGTTVGSADTEAGASGKGGDRPGYLRRDTITGPLPAVIERLWQTTWGEIGKQGVIAGLTRQERPEYPAFAVREAIINALAHRDYRVTGRRVEVRLFDDRLEVSSPGGLAGHVTLDTLVEEHYSRNPRLVRALFRWGYIEELGLGIDRMIEAMVSAGRQPPVFKATPHTFTVTLYRAGPGEMARAERILGLSERQQKAMETVRETGRITNRDYRALYPDLSDEAIRLDLADLVERGFLLRVGDKKGTYYILKE